MTLETTIAGAYPKIGDSTEEQKLRKALHQLDKGEISDEDLDRIKGEVIEEVIRQQIDAGIDIVTDGLIRWDDPLTYFARRISGFEMSGLIRYFDTNTFFRQPIVETRLEYIKPIFVSDFQFAQEKSSKPVKAVMTGPYTLGKLTRNKFYRESKQLLFDLAHIIHREALALEEAGCRYIQFDEPAILQHKHDFQIFSQVYEIVTAQLTKSEKILNLNFGNLDGIYPKVLNVNVERIGLDLTKNHKNWEVIKSAPFTKKMMAGVIDSRNTKMESEAEVSDAIHQLGEIVNQDHLWLSTNYSLEFLPRQNARKKMEFLAQTAKQLRGASVS
jgi:5-methyltetrahydropteroyltriglutamate--homocysteine methyltransferase